MSFLRSLASIEVIPRYSACSLLCYRIIGLWFVVLGVYRHCISPLMAVLSLVVLEHEMNTGLP